MGNVELDPIIRIKLIIFLVGYLTLAFIFRYFMKKYLKIEKRESFFRKPINTEHKKINRILTSIFISLIVVGYFYETRILNGMSGLFITPLIFLGFTVVTEIVRVYIQWKYSDNRNEYILTLSELLFSVILLAIAFLGNIFGLFR